MVGQLTCNGYAQLCSRRIDQVAFAGTHNSMSAADSPGWLIANQARPIARQLDDGIRAFKISTHYAVGNSPGRIRTDIAAEGQRANRVSQKLTGEARSALQRLSGSIGFGTTKGRPSVWLCHTLCELGATSMVSFLDTIDKFLKDNPAHLPLTKRSFILRRARQCQAQRHRLRNLILTDFYDSGDVVGAARILNGLGNLTPALIVALEHVVK